MGVVPDIPASVLIAVGCGVAAFARVDATLLPAQSLKVPNLYTWLEVSRIVQPVSVFVTLLWLVIRTHSALTLVLLPVSLPGESYWTAPILTAEAA